MPGRFRVLLETLDRPLLFAGGFIICILAVGTIYTEATQGNALLLSPTYLLLQLKVASFLGIVAAAMMMVVLLGHIDLSVPWTIAASAMLATAWGGAMAIPIGLAFGPSAVPEPSTLVLMVLGSLSLVGYWLIRRDQAITSS